MQCPNCGNPLEPGKDTCSHCQRDSKVTVLSRQERDNFSGMTIDEDRTDKRYQGYSSNTGQEPRFKRVNVSLNASSLTGKLILAAVLALIVFFFLPLFMFIAVAVGAIAIAFWLIRMLRS